ncbi:MAG TPA: hypothetical protein VK724_08035 [Bryobacteraceae bacterium]|jgi:hypothetical protein|nr:hypothetical protein [Bryobacteraceae bacterium]
MVNDSKPRSGRPVIVLDGTESVYGRALFAISALYWCAEWLANVEFRLIDVSDEDVLLAVAVLRADMGADLEVRPSSKDFSPLGDADLYVAAAFRSAQHLRLSEAAYGKIPVLLAMQFPDAEYINGSVLRQRAAFEPKLFAEELYAIVKPWL